MPSPDLKITALVQTFVQQMAAAMEAHTARRVQAVLAVAFGPVPKRGPGKRARQAAVPVASSTAARKRRKRQPGRVPWFENPAGPSAGMTCIDLGDMAISKVKRRPQHKVATPKAARARNLQGQYLGSLKSLKGAARAKVKRIAKEKGVAEAVKLARSLKKA